MSRRNLPANIEQTPLWNYPLPSIDVQIRIRRLHARYSADISTAGRAQRVDLDISPEDLEMLNQDIRQPIEDLLEWGNSDWSPFKDEIEDLLRPLASSGKFAFNKIFGSSSAKKAIKEILKFEGRLSFEIASEDFCFPWELLYHGDLKKRISINGFWGMQFIISRIIIKPFKEGWFLSPLIKTKELPNIGLICDQTLSNVKNKEIPFFEQLKDEKVIHLSMLSPLNNSNWSKDFSKFKDFLNEYHNLLHLACHASFKKSSPPDSFISISDNYEISLKNIENYELEVNGHPLVFLNACETANLNPLHTFHFANSFLESGARGVVVTEFKVPDSFAADFVENFYAHFLNGKPLGESLLTTRRSFAKQNKNPLGLLYSMYASPWIRLDLNNIHAQ